MDEEVECEKIYIKKQEREIMSEEIFDCQI